MILSIPNFNCVLCIGYVSFVLAWSLNNQTLQNESAAQAVVDRKYAFIKVLEIKLILRKPIFMWVYYPAPDTLSMWSAVQWTGFILYEQQARQGVFIKFTSLIFSGCVGCNGKVQKLPGNITKYKILKGV